MFGAERDLGLAGSHGLKTQSVNTGVAAEQPGRLHLLGFFALCSLLEGAREAIRISPFPHWKEAFHLSGAYDSHGPFRQCGYRSQSRGPAPWLDENHGSDILASEIGKVCD